jgi:hypothetical protein
MTLRHYFITAATTLLCGLSVPAHASCFGLLDEGCKLSVAKEDDLSFGSMVVTGSGEATLDPISGALSGSAMTPALFLGSTKPAKFTVTCSVSPGVKVNFGNFSYRVSVSVAPDLNKIDGPPSAAMALRQFSIRPTPELASASYYVETCSSYKKTFTVGATLGVGASQIFGNYQSLIEFVVSP